METYTERLQKRKGNIMTNYDMDEIERQRARERKSRGIRPEDNRESAITMEIPDAIVLKLAVKAHERGITLNKMINIAIDNMIETSDCEVKHSPQILNETIYSK